ncbi:MAG: tetratricopeptide repeat protein [Nitrospira sp.]|nr:tetratricopeptide repeat protein [Nitrospira sp.]
MFMNMVLSVCREALSVLIVLYVVATPAASTAAHPVLLAHLDQSVQFLKAVSMSDSGEPPAPPLPDEGPQVNEDQHVHGIVDLAWQEGRLAYHKGLWLEAKRFFEKIVVDYPESPLAPAALAFAAESLLREHDVGGDRTEAIQLYKRLLRDYSATSYAKRAAWRLGDLYREQGWLQEAQFYYEQAIAQGRDSFDGDRALLGLAYTFMAMRKWSDAEHAFSALRKGMTHELLAPHAAIGLAHALFRQQRLTEAQVLYELGYRRWPTFFRRDPLAIQRDAVIHAMGHRHRAARELLLLLYNLYPRHEFAPVALLYVADSLSGDAHPLQAAFFYAAVPSLYPASPYGTAAAMRLASLYLEQKDQVDNDRWKLAVAAMTHDDSLLEINEETYVAMLREIAARDANNAVGVEALVHLGSYYEKSNDGPRALFHYKEAAQRAGSTGSPWARRAGERLSALLAPWLEGAINGQNDFLAISLFHRYGGGAESFLSSPMLVLRIAEAHRRLGFATEAGRLYQQLTKAQDLHLLELALVGLGKSYLDQEDPQAARKVLERYRFQFQAGRYESEVLHLLVTAMRRQGDLEGAMRLCRQWLQHHPQGQEEDRSYMLRQLAEVLGELNRLDESAKVYEIAIKQGQPSTDLFIAFAETLSRLNRHEQAIAAYQAALDRQPDHRQREWIHLRTALHWNALKHYDRATVALAEVGETDDPLVNRFVDSLKNTVRTARRLQMAKEDS